MQSSPGLCVIRSMIHPRVCGAMRERAYPVLCSRYRLPLGSVRSTPACAGQCAREPTRCCAAAIVCRWEVYDPPPRVRGNFTT